MRRILNRLPSWFPSNKTELKVYWDTFKFNLNPFKCEDCGKEVLYSHPEYQGRNCMVSSIGHILCRDCLAKRIKEWYGLPYAKRVEYDPHYDFHRELHGHKHCDGCKKQRQLQSIISSSFLNIRFGVRWWNGHYLCESCLVDAVLNGHYMSKVSIFFENGKKYKLNEAGAIVNGK